MHQKKLTTMLSLYVPLILSATSSVPAICWLINRIGERRFCRKATKEERDSYIELRKVTSKTGGSIVRRLYQEEGIKKIAS